MQSTNADQSLLETNFRFQIVPMGDNLQSKLLFPTAIDPCLLIARP